MRDLSPHELQQARVEHKQHQHPSLTCHSEHAMSKFSRHISEKLNVRKMFLSSSKMRTLFVSEIGSSHCPTISYIQRLMRHGPYYFTQGPDSRAYSTSEGFVSLTLRACANLLQTVGHARLAQHVRAS